MQTLRENIANRDIALASQWSDPSYLFRATSIEESRTNLTAVDEYMKNFHQNLDEFPRFTQLSFKRRAQTQMSEICKEEVRIASGNSPV